MTEQDWFRILSLVDVRGEDECWKWTGYINHLGYSQIRIGGRKGKLQLGHRVIYELFVGEIPSGLTIDHLCRVRHCVNPAHLEPVTNRENIMRGVGASARNAKKTHCVRAHPFDEENTYILPNGRRLCKACNRIRANERYHRVGKYERRKSRELSRSVVS